MRWAMVDAYMGAAHRADRAREQARAFNAPTVGFVAPGIPVDAAPPPSAPPPVGVGGAASAGAGAAFGPLALVGVVAGFGFGWWATSDVREWKRGHYKKSKVYRGYPDYDPLFSFNQEIDLSKRFAQPLQVNGSEVAVPSDFYAPDDKHGPAFYDEFGFYHWYTYHLTCAANPSATLWRPDWSSSSGCAGEADQNWYNNVGNAFCGTLGGVSSAGDRPFQYHGNWVCPDLNDPNNYASNVGGYTRVSSLAIKIKDVWLHHTDFNPTGKKVVTQVGLSRLHQPVFLEGLTYGHASTVDEGEPSGAQQTAPARLARGRMGDGYVVPFALAHPFTLIRVADGSPSVSVPDQVIDPEEGTVTLHPPGQPPGNPNDSERREKKPLPQRIAHMGFVAINVVTETQDFMEALHKGLPKGLRSKPRRKGADVPPWVIARDIWDHWDDWDAEVALEAFVNNQIEDALYGRFFAQQAAAQRRLGVTAGMARGTRVYRPGGEPVTLPVPEVHFANGQHSVSVGGWNYDPVSGRLTEGE